MLILDTVRGLFLLMVVTVPFRGACSWSLTMRCVSTWKASVTWPWGSSTKASKHKQKSCWMTPCSGRKPARNISKSNTSEVSLATPSHRKHSAEHVYRVSVLNASLSFFPPSTQNTLVTCTLISTYLWQNIMSIRIFQETLKTTGQKTFLSL